MESYLPIAIKGIFSKTSLRTPSLATVSDETEFMSLSTDSNSSQAKCEALNVEIIANPRSSRYKLPRLSRIISAFRQTDQSAGQGYVTTRLNSRQPKKTKKQFDRARWHCCRTHIILRTMSELLNELIGQQIASGCAMKVSKEDSTNDAWILERILEMTNTGDIVDSSPQGLHQMLRLCNWFCDKIRDELLGLKIDTNKDKKWPASKHAFVEKWDVTPDESLERAQFSIDGSEPIQAISTERLLGGTITSNPVATAVEFWISFSIKYHAQQSKDRSQRNERVCLKGSLSRVKSHLNRTCHLGTSGESEMQALDIDRKILVKMRCQRNIRTTKAYLNSFLDEVDQELERRWGCTHGKPCRHHKDSTPGLRMARSKLQKMISDLDPAEWTSMTLFNEPMKASDMPFFAEWGSLPMNGFNILVGLKSEELVEKLIRRETVLEEEDTGEGEKQETIPVDGGYQVTPEDIFLRAGLRTDPRRARKALSCDARKDVFKEGYQIRRARSLGQ